LILYGLLHLPIVQTWLTQRFTNYFSSKLHTKIEIKGVDITFFKNVILEGFYMEDLHKDTLLYSKKIKFSISDFVLNKSKFDLNYCELENSDLHLKKYKGEEQLNLQFILNALKSNNPKDTSKSGLLMNCKQLKLNNVNFSLIDENDTTRRNGINFNNLHISNIYGDLYNIMIQGDSIKSNLKGLSFVDKSGFILNELSADIKYSSNSISFKSLRIKTPNSNIYGEYSMMYDSLACFDDFENKINLKSKFEKSLISFQDIKYFVPEFNQLKTYIIISGDIRGNISKLRCKQLDISLGDVTHFKGNINIDGLPDINETFIDLSLDEFKTNKRDVEKIELPPFDNKHYIELPENLSELGTIKLNGKFTGFVNDFVAFGNLQTNIGNISTDINLKFNKQTQTTSYSGKLATTNFNIGKILKQEPLLGFISCNASVKGNTIQIPDNYTAAGEENILLLLNHYFKKFNADLDGNISDIDINGYNYKNIILDGHVANRQFKGNLKINDENVGLDFVGTVDFSKELPIFDFYSNLSNAHLSRLNLIKRDVSSSLSSNMSVHFSGNKLDNINGDIILNKTRYSEKSDTLKIDSLNLSASDSSEIKTLDLTSDILDANFKGRYKFNQLFHALKELVGNFIPEYKDTGESKVLMVQAFDFSLYFRNANEATKIFLPQLKVAPNTIFNGSFNSYDSKLLLTGVSPEIRLDKFAVKDFEINTSTDKNFITSDANCYKLFLSDSLWINDVQLSSQIKHDSIFFQAQLQNIKNSPNHARLNGLLAFTKGNDILLRILPSEIVVENKPWEINSKNLVDIDTTSYTVNNFELTSGEQKIKINGKLSDNSSDKMNLSLSNVNLNNFEQLLKPINISATGVISGDADLSGPLTRLHINSSIGIDKLNINGDSLGNATIATTWDDATQVAGVIANVVNGNAKTIDIHGNFYAAKNTDRLDFDVNIDKINADIFNKFLESFVAMDKNSKGRLSANIKLRGNPDEPIITGKLKFQSVGFVIKYLNTHYTFSHDIDVDEKAISFENLELIDDKGNKAIGKGSIYHNKFKDIRFDMSFFLKKFQMLNTNINQNNLFYGSAYATGTVAVTGPIDNINLNVGVKSEKGTKINIPMNANNDVSDNDFVTFVSQNSAGIEQHKYEANLSGITMNFDFEVTPEAEVQIIFDERVGDKIRGTGSGNIKMEITPFGDFNMYGNYTIEKGDYLFTFRDITNKKFIIDNGGTIHWDGPALDADINLSAIYTVQTSLSGLVQPISSQDSLSLKEVQKVECKLTMSGKLLSPNIKFDISFPDLTDNNLLDEVNRVLNNNDAERSKQAFALIALGYFLPSGNNNVPLDLGTAYNNLSQMLSSQLSILTGQISKDFNLGVNYHPAGTLSKEEMDVLIATRLFNDRLSINGSFGYATNQTASNVVGDVIVDYKLSKSGNFHLKAFNKTNSNAILNESLYTQGAGFLWRKDFDHFGDLFKPNPENKKKKDESQQKPDSQQK